MRLCFLADTDSIHTQKWITFFAARGHEVHVISFGKTQISNTIHHRLKFPSIVEKAREKSHSLKLVMFPIKFFISYFTLKLLMKQIKPDVLHAHYVTNYGFFGGFANFKPYVITAWGNDVLNVLQNFLLGFARSFMAAFVLKKADLITADAPHLVQRFINLGFNQQKILLINFGVDTDKFKPNHARKQGATVISTRRLEPLYNVRSFIEAIPQVVKQVPEAKFVVVNTGSQEHCLKQRIKNLGLSDRVRFIGQVSNNDMPNILNQADVYVSTSLSDGGIAMSTAEAMACELPIIITDNSCNSQWIKDGILVPNNDVEALSKAIVTTLQTLEAQPSYGQANRTFVMQHDNYQKEMLEMEKTYYDLQRFTAPNA